MEIPALMLREYLDSPKPAKILTLGSFEFVKVAGKRFLVVQLTFADDEVELDPQWVERTAEVDCSLVPNSALEGLLDWMITCVEATLAVEIARSWGVNPNDLHKFELSLVWDTTIERALNEYKIHGLLKEP